MIWLRVYVLNFIAKFERLHTVRRHNLRAHAVLSVGRDSPVVPSWLALCWVLGSNLSADTYSSEYHHGGRGFYPGAGFPSCHKSIYRVSQDNFRGSACVSEWMLISLKKDGGLVFHNLKRLHKDNKLEQIKKMPF
jgi:hypothetical protein